MYSEQPLSFLWMRRIRLCLRQSSGRPERNRLPEATAPHPKKSSGIPLRKDAARAILSSSTARGPTALFGKPRRNLQLHIAPAFVANARPDSYPGQTRILVPAEQGNRVKIPDIGFGMHRLQSARERIPVAVISERVLWAPDSGVYCESRSLKGRCAARREGGGAR